MKLTLPDSGTEIDIERVPLTFLEMIEAGYDKDYPNKPAIPTKKIRDTQGNVTATISMPTDTRLILEELKKPNLSSELRDSLMEDLDQITAYTKAKEAWDTEVREAKVQMWRYLYAKNLNPECVDLSLVQKAIKDASDFQIDLPQQILDTYAEHNIPFDESVMERWIYLWMVAARSATDSGYLNTWMRIGSKEARQAAAQALFPV